MKAKQLFDRLINNWPVKAFCFAMALLLYVFYQSQSLEKKVVSVPLDVNTENGFVAVEPHPAVVAVTITGKGEELAQIRESDISAYLDLSYVSKEGKYNFPVLLALSSSASVVNPLEIKVTPESVSLAVEEEVSSYVDLTPLVKGKPAYGYELKSVKLSPEQIKITGPRSMVLNCKSLQTKSINIDGASKGFIDTVGIEKKGIFINHENVSVTAKIDLSEIMTSKTFDNITVNLTNINENLDYDAVERISLTLKGSLAELESFRPDTFMILGDCSEITEPGTYEIALKYIIPSYFTLSDDQVKSIPVTFVVSAPSEEKVSVTETPSGIIEEKIIDPGVMD